MKTEKQFDLEEYHGEWELIKQFDTREEAEQELKFYQHHFPTRVRVVERTYKILYERSKE